MALDFTDPKNGFRHSEVVKFINEEILSNGGLNFFLALHSRPWSEVEDRLQALLADQQIPHAIKRACTWSALALNVRLAARQREHHRQRMRRLQEHLVQREAAAAVMASELRSLRQEHEEMALRLRSTSDSLQQALEEHDVLRQRLLQVERAAPASSHDLTGSPTYQPEAEGCPQDNQKQDIKVRIAQSRVYAESQKEWEEKETCAGTFFRPGQPSPWAPAIQPTVINPHSQLFPYHIPFPDGFPYSPSPLPIVMKTETEVSPPVPFGGIYNPTLWAALESQEEMVSGWDQINQGKVQGTVKPTFIQPFESYWSQGDPVKDNHEEKTWPTKVHRWCSVEDPLDDILDRLKL